MVDREVEHVTRTPHASVARCPLRPFSMERYTILPEGRGEPTLNDRMLAHRSLLCRVPEPAGSTAKQYSHQDPSQVMHDPSKLCGVRRTRMVHSAPSVGLTVVEQNPVYGS